jgi:pimeloyl-ACP methyl ester carboxylesterase
MRPRAVALLTAAFVLASTAPALAASHHRGLPGDAPRALYAAQPHLPGAAGWPGSNNAFSRTSGTGRVTDGGFYWTDWLYDDHGTTTTSLGDISVTAGTPSFGTYTYPSGDHNNGADIFRAAVLLRKHASYWRVDWNTLTDPAVPIAEWTFDRDNNTRTGASAWPGSAGVHSAGIDTALLVSSHGAALINAASDTVIRRLPTTVGRSAHSFVVRIPRRVLAPHGDWRIRLAAGLANAAGNGFARPPDALQTQPAVYNMTFRRRSQEPVTDDFWDDQAQTQQLSSGNASAFSTVVHWTQLARRRRTPQPRPAGWSDRWYVSAVDLGPGMVTTPATTGDGTPNYLGRVQPYAVYVPKAYRPGHPAPLTFLLHSLLQNHNQYAATTPGFTTLACEDRHSICVSPLGRGPDGNYFDYAELDFWQVWHAAAQAYSLAPDRTILAGYSMGGIGSNQLAMEHPDLFAKAVTLAGAVGAVPELENLRWVPDYLAGGLTDELVPVTVEQTQADALAALGDRFRWLIWAAVDHVTFELADAFTDAAQYMGNAHVVHNPGSFRFTWTPRNAQSVGANALTGGSGISTTQLPEYGVGTTGDYWLRGLKARSRTRSASIAAFSGMRPDRGVKTRLKRGLAVSSGPGPGIATQLSWTRTKQPSKQAVIRLHLTNVRSLRVRLRDAGFGEGEHGRLRITTDGPVVIDLGNRTLHLRSGSHVVTFTA